MPALSPLYSLLMNRTAHTVSAVLQVSELEKEVKLKQLSLKDIQNQLDTERSLSSKLYDDVSLCRDLYCVRLSLPDVLTDSLRHSHSLPEPIIMCS